MKNRITITAIIIFSFFTVSCSSKEKPICRSFSLKNIDKVVFRAIYAQQAEITQSSSDQLIKICATPSGDVVGYHSPDPDWKMRSPSEWGFGFKSKIFGRTLVISSLKEYVMIHHDYRLIELKVYLPASIKLVTENRIKTGNAFLESTPDLRPPQE